MITEEEKLRRGAVLRKLFDEATARRKKAIAENDTEYLDRLDKLEPSAAPLEEQDDL